MPSTITLQATINWALSFLDQQPLLINGMEPALGSANLILQTILGPPFAWPFNRAIITFTTSDQDNQQTGLANYGFPEGGTVQSDSGGKPYELAVKQVLQSEGNLARPLWYSPWIDDGAGAITFRLMPAPDQLYRIILPYQKRAPLLLSLAYTWAPLPDDKNYIAQWGFLALMSLIGNDARFNEYNQKFVTSLLAAQGALTDLERNIFLANWTRVMSNLQGTQLGTQERFRAREI
jgi:hypothetical protein